MKQEQTTALHVTQGIATAWTQRHPPISRPPLPTAFP